MVPIAKGCNAKHNLIPVGTISAPKKKNHISLKERNFEPSLKVHSSQAQKSFPFFYNHYNPQQNQTLLPKTEATSNEILTLDEMLNPMHKDDKAIEERWSRDEGKVERLKERLIEFQPDCQCISSSSKGKIKKQISITKYCSLYYEILGFCNIKIRFLHVINAI